MAQQTAAANVSKVSEGFAALDEALLLDPQQDKQAKEIRGKLDDILREAGWMKQTLLQGSYGRKTMLPPLKDVDVAVILPEGRRHLQEDPWGPARAMEGFREAITASGAFPGVRFDPDGPSAHALQLELPEATFTVDLVPAFETGGYEWLVIADRDERRWDERSDVRGLRDKIVVRNGLCGGRWVHQVRYGKHALRKEPDVKELVCGLIIESLAYDSIKRAVSPQDAAVAIFGRGVEVLGDPYFGLAQNDLTKKWSDVDRRRVLDYFQRMLKLSRQAVACEEADDHAAAAGLWRQVYGEEFPAISVPFQDQLGRIARQGGSVSSAGHLTTSPRVPGATRPARPWRSS